MSALDDVILYAVDACYEKHLDEARAELELLRGLAFDYAAMTVRGGMSKVYCCTRFHVGATDHDHECRPMRILRTDPERAKAMGLGWAL